MIRKHGRQSSPTTVGAFQTNTPVYRISSRPEGPPPSGTLTKRARGGIPLHDAKSHRFDEVFVSCQDKRRKPATSGSGFDIARERADIGSAHLGRRMLEQQE